MTINSRFVPTKDAWINGVNSLTVGRYALLWSIKVRDSLYKLSSYGTSAEILYDWPRIDWEIRGEGE